MFVPLLEKEAKAEIAAKWDDSSESYDSHHGHGIKTKKEHEAWIEALSGVLPPIGSKVLDVGCGTGEMSCLLAEMGYIVTGVDLSERMLQKARSKANVADLKVRFEPGDAEKLSFEDESFDAVINRHVFWTLLRPRSALQEWKRVLKNKGRLIVIDGLWMDVSLESKLRRLIGDLSILILKRRNPREGWYSKETELALPHPRGMDVQKARTYLEEAGFKGIDLTYLDNIRNIQRKHMPFSQRVTHDAAYYMICGQK